MNALARISGRPPRLPLHMALIKGVSPKDTPRANTGLRHAKIALRATSWKGWASNCRQSTIYKPIMRGLSLSAQNRGVACCIGKASVCGPGAAPNKGKIHGKGYCLAAPPR